MSCSAHIRFVESEGYEPPQGNVLVEQDFNHFFRKHDDDGYSGQWRLIEDEEGRKDGLWVWGLYQEPQYPYLTFKMDVHDSLVTGPAAHREKVFGGAGIPGQRLRFRFEHMYDHHHLILKNGKVTFKVKELADADLFHLGGQVDIGESIVAGSVSLTFLGQRTFK